MILWFAGELGLEQVNCFVGVLSFHVLLWFSAESPGGKKRKRYGVNSTYRSEVLVYPATNKRAHAVAWASTYHLVAKENYQFSDRDFKRMLQKILMKYRKLINTERM